MTLKTLATEPPEDELTGADAAGAVLALLRDDTCWLKLVDITRQPYGYVALEFDIKSYRRPAQRMRWVFDHQDADQLWSLLGKVLAR